MTELRRRMDDDMVARGFAERTRESYLWAVTGLARFYRRAPDRISDAEVQAYLVHLLRERQRSWSTCNVVANGLRFFFHTTLKRDRTTFTIPAPRQRQKLPAILSREEVEQVIAQPRIRNIARGFSRPTLRACDSTRSCTCGSPIMIRRE
jgi:integrase/recombinase XerD